MPLLPPPPPPPPLDWAAESELQEAGEHGDGERYDEEDYYDEDYDEDGEYYEEKGEDQHDGHGNATASTSEGGRVLIVQRPQVGCWPTAKRSQPAGWFPFACCAQPAAAACPPHL
jgi:hypothetical protein